MRIALIGLAVITIMLPAGVELASAQPRPWCLQTGRGGPGGGIPDCTYYTLQQCRATVSGIGGYCKPNPFYDGSPIGGQPRSKRQRL